MKSPVRRPELQATVTSEAVVAGVLTSLAAVLI
jgi:hypothetical protein